jgi:hypothetical protein
MSSEVGERDELETALAELVCLSMVVEEVRIRVRQAIRRTKVVEEVLGPVDGRLAELNSSLDLVRVELQKVWEEERERRLG